ncbi:MAG: AAA family ATPase [Lachnospiraceae bacterium]|nr:AAA family ATPase [Lachnospiraceae bacterium]
MRIKSVACDQFAGLLDKELEFDKGLNIILGDNETGKSTIVELIYHMLFQDAKLDARKDTAFLENYFPKKLSGPVGDVIDGELRFQTEDGNYKLTKEWDKKNGSCKLRTPDGTVIKSEEQIKDILGDILGYGQGVYGEIVFPTQKRSQDAIASIMKEFSKKKSDKLDELKGELASVLNQAALETGGISIDKLETELKNLLNMYGERWDFELDLPEGGAKRGLLNPWKSVAYTKAADEGKQAIILRGYYNLKEIEKQQADTLVSEKKVETCKEKLINAQQGRRNAQDERDKFTGYVSILSQVNMLKEKVVDLQDMIKGQEEAAQDWPKREELLVKLEALKCKLAQAKTRDLYLKVSELQKALDGCKAELSGVKAVDIEDIKLLKNLTNQVGKLEGQISGLNLMAKIKKLGEETINITSATTGETIELSGDELIINEAVDIVIPHIMELQLMPQGVEISEVKTALKEFNQRIDGIYKKYQVDSLEQLEDSEARYRSLTVDISSLNERIDMRLGGKSWEELKTENSKLPEMVESEVEVKNQIAMICSADKLDENIAQHLNMVEIYTKRYTSKNELSKFILSDKQEIDKLTSKLDILGEVPAEYAEITDTDEYEKKLKAKIEDFENLCQQAQEELKNAELELGDRTSEEYEEALVEAKQSFDSAKEAYAHWYNIYQTFNNLKENLKGNPTVDIEDKFNSYLEIISKGKLSLVDMDDKLNVKLASDNHAMSYDILSEGTKDTVSLAFRLAMLEHIFPEGGGLAIFDDPFTDMDPNRVAEACKLIEKLAQNNQVIFVTCDEKYVAMMDGNVLTTM